MNKTGTKALFGFRSLIGKTLTLLLVTLSGCSTLQSKAFNQIHAGDSRQHVTEVMGEPDDFSPGKNGVEPDIFHYKGNYVWNGDNTECFIALQQEKVVNLSCGQSNQASEYRAKVGASMGQMFQAMGKGLQDSSHEAHCTTTGGSGIYTTNCY